MTPITCPHCAQPIMTFDQWYSEPCPKETPGDPGHELTWEQIMALQFRPVVAAEQHEAKL